MKKLTDGARMRQLEKKCIEDGVSVDEYNEYHRLKRRQQRKRAAIAAEKAGTKRRGK